MSETRKSILASIKDKLPLEVDGDVIHEESVLAELGMDSLRLITLFLALRREYSLEMRDIAERGLPTTVGDLITLVERGRQT